MLELIQAHSKEIVSFLTPVFAVVVGVFFRLRARLHYSIQHAWSFLVEQPLLDQEGKQIAPNQRVQTASIMLTNAGLAAAKSVEITFNWKPQIMNVWPARFYEQLEAPMGRFTLKFDSLAPREFIGIEIMSINAPLPDYTSIRSESAAGKKIEMHPQRVWPQWYLRLAAISMFLGAATSVYLTIAAVQWASN